jgi:hypothetical protein
MRTIESAPIPNVSGTPNLQVLELSKIVKNLYR